MSQNSINNIDVEFEALSWTIHCDKIPQSVSEVLVDQNKSGPLHSLTSAIEIIFAAALDFFV